jgi:hypothetical protein
MIESAMSMSCADFHAQLPDLIGSGENITDHRHVQNCALCRALLADLEAIAQAARQLFPVEEPPEALWQYIESAIARADAATDFR